MKNYGFREELVKIEPEAWIRLGGAGETVRPDGVWPLVLYEPQALTFETCACTCFGMTTQVEMYLKERYGFEPNYSERYHYNDVGISCPGANPQDVYQSAHRNGLIGQEELSMTDTLEEYKTPRPLTETLIRKGQKWPYELTHWWLSDTSKESLIEQLKYCPIGASVTAWYEEDGVYVDKGQSNNHWVVIFSPADYKGRKTVKVFDSYDHSVKILHPDHRISFAKAISITPVSENEQQEIIGGIIDFFVKVWTRILKALFNR